MQEPQRIVYREIQCSAKDLDGHLWLFSRDAQDLKFVDFGRDGRESAIISIDQRHPRNRFMFQKA